MAALRNIDSPGRGVLFLDNDLRITFANRRAAELFGTTVQEMAGAELPEAITRRTPAQDEAVEEVLERSLRPDAVLHRYSTPVYDSAGNPAGRVEIYSDITARRELEKEILDRNRALADLNAQLQDAQEQLVHSERLRAVGEMAAGVAHDINNVLGIILGNAQLALRKLDPDSDAATSMRAIELAARDGAETVRRLREMSKPPDTSLHAPVDLSEIAEDVVRTAVPAWRQTEADCEDISVETDLPGGCLVIGNAAELREALANVLLNAVQATGACGKIAVAVRRSDMNLDLEVADTGAGMDNETRDRLFDPFFTTRGADGTGLGMSVVEAIAIRHRGRVIVDSKESKGTKVTLRFPAFDAARDGHHSPTGQDGLD